MALDRLDVNAVGVVVIGTRLTGSPYYAADGSAAGRPLDQPADLGYLSEVALRQPLAEVEYRLQVAKGGRVWYYPIETVNNSENGFERVYHQGRVAALRQAGYGRVVNTVSEEESVVQRNAHR